VISLPTPKSSKEYLIWHGSGKQCKPNFEKIPNLEQEMNDNPAWQSTLCL
jgi:hypothetical protein